MDTSGAETMLKSQAVLAEQKEFVFPAVKPLYDQPVVISEGEGVRVRDVDGVEYLDLFS